MNMHIETAIQVTKELLISNGIVVLDHPRRLTISTDVRNFTNLVNINVRTAQTTDLGYLVIYSIDLLPVDALKVISDLPDYSMRGTLANRLVTWYKMKNLKII